nr:immunoglobulin light chain junction region [Macaca mulatta]MOV92744.1 immunoglobulin light chain junction region [Macaca mulatta]MOV93374.1 immunoglobulin light chain junction region [Macaca mulatta]MPN91496.1 immunoglobulin light chain junction region [Macaca mulatta]MPN92163.1 immunoglobulin light chain junction region [Macaca mulatta]
CQQHNSRPLTF